MLAYFSVGPDISKVRSRLKANITILDDPNTQEILSKKLSVIFFDLISAHPSSTLFTEAELPQFFLELLRRCLLCDLKSIVQFPFRISHNSVLLIEQFYAMENAKSLPDDINYLLKHFSRENCLNMLKSLELQSNQSDPIQDYRTKFTPQDDPEFPLLFAYTLRQTSVYELNSFLSYHKDHYDGSFSQFLLQVLLDDCDDSIISDKQKAACHIWLEGVTHSQEARTSIFPSPTTPKNWTKVPGLLNMSHPEF